MIGLKKLQCTASALRTSQRSFSTSNLEHVQERFPYVLGNNLKLIKTRETTKPGQLKMCQNFLATDKSQISLGFFMAYKCLLESLVADDRETLEDICEGDLYRKFSDSLDMLNEQEVKLELVNKTQHQKNKITGSLDLIDFQNFAGARIDRSINRENGIKEMSPFWVKLPNFTIYMPSNPFKMTASFFGDQKSAPGAMQIDTLTVEIIVAFKSNLKLDLVDLHPDKGQQRTTFLTRLMRPEEEIHFVKFEGKLPTIELSMATVKDQNNFKKMLEIEDWTITDFDNCLLGNPHV